MWMNEIYDVLVLLCIVVFIQEEFDVELNLWCPYFPRPTRISHHLYRI